MLANNQLWLFGYIYQCNNRIEITNFLFSEKIEILFLIKLSIISVLTIPIFK